MCVVGYFRHLEYDRHVEDDKVKEHGRKLSILDSQQRRKEFQGVRETDSSRCTKTPAKTCPHGKGTDPALACLITYQSVWRLSPPIVMGRQALSSDSSPPHPCLPLSSNNLAAGIRRGFSVARQLSI